MLKPGAIRPKAFKVYHRFEIVLEGTETNQNGEETREPFENARHDAETDLRKCGD